MIEENTLAIKCKKFAVRVVNFCRYLNETKNEIVLSKQILRSGTSIGANVAEAKYAASRKDFSNKLCIALKECSETLYWLELLHETDYISTEQYESMFHDCDEIRKILSSSTKTMKVFDEE